MDVFDAFQNQEYATLKFQNDLPEKLSLYSDIDMLVDKKSNSQLVNMLQNHALVAKVTCDKKSFMNTVQVITDDGEILSIDLIWQLKRKNLELLNANQIIATNYRNEYNVKCASNTDTARFVALFYILNNAKIPSKYLDYQEVIKTSQEPIDIVIKNYFMNTNKDKNLLITTIKNRKKNKGFSYLKNSLFYIIDVLKKHTKPSGFTITFSGVDGAGKSTVIENIAVKIEKQFRKPVLVLRHRPSILPILSVWTKGKEKAHLDSISHLPRQGQNASFLSSLLRFSYYYFDYLLGQFVIYFKYILTGKIVIYDRYYFDFINDGKRSNIVLPKFITSAGYTFLLKPKFNFFLYADANIILNRKKELTKATIEELTSEYKGLFQSLKTKSKSTVYETINNEDLDVTLNHILKTITLS
jgi:thymidylate kinase